MTSLYKITQNILEIESQLLENGGEISENLESFLELNQNNLAVKIDDYSHLIDRLERTTDFFKLKKEEAAKAQKTFENTIDKLKERLRFAMSEMQTNELNGHDYKFKLSRSKSKVKIVDESKISAQFIREKISFEVDKEKIFEALEKGEVVQGAILEENFSLRKYVNK